MAGQWRGGHGGPQVGGAGVWHPQRVARGRHHQAGHLGLLQPKGRRRKQVGSLNSGRQKAPEGGRREPSGRAYPPLPPLAALAPLRHSRRPHLEGLSGGRAMTRGREVSTTSPRLASTRMFWIMFSSSASCRLANAGSLRGGDGGRTRVSAPPSTALVFSAGLFRAVPCVPWAQPTWILIPLPARPAL